MTSWQREIDRNRHGSTIAAVVLAIAAIAWATFLGTRARDEPSRCGDRLFPLGARCCAEGQTLAGGACVGLPRACPAGFELVDKPAPGCVITPRRVPLAGGSVTLGPTDWDTVNVVERRILAVRSFRIDQAEVTVSRYQECLRAGVCTKPPLHTEPGVPVTGLSPLEAETFCAFGGGRLPTAAEWIFAATGADARRFPWGPHGLVCRRAAYGLASGPCSEGASSPELAGSRPEGRTPEGLLDLAGNVAEWAREPDGTATVHGGSYRSSVASDLKTWSLTSTADHDDVGFRCVYPTR